MAEINGVVKSGAQQIDDMPRRRVPEAAISEVTRAFIKGNLVFSPEAAGQILGKSPRTILELVKDGKLIAADDKAKMGKNGLRGSNGLQITAESIEEYRKSIIIPPEKWAE